MKVETRPHEIGTHRAEYEITWHDWALPLRVVSARSWLPNDKSSTDDLSTWDVREYVVIHVLFARMRLVVSGLLWPDEQPEE